MMIDPQNGGNDGTLEEDPERSEGVFEGQEQDQNDDLEFSRRCMWCSFVILVLGVVVLGVFSDFVLGCIRGSYFLVM